MNRVEVALVGARAPRWRLRVAPLCRRALAAAGIDGWDLSVALAGDAFIRQLNRRYRGRDRATDVLSFSQTEGPKVTRAGCRGPAGDLVISVETLRRNARQRGVTEHDELVRLLVHGILHLAGMDHGRGKGTAMRDREERIFVALQGAGAQKNRVGRP